MTAPLDHRRPALLRRALLAGWLCLAALQLGCGQDPGPAARADPAGDPPRGVAALPVADRPPPDAASRRLDACVEAALHGPGYDELAARDRRRKLRRLEVRAECGARRAD